MKINSRQSLTKVAIIGIILCFFFTLTQAQDLSQWQLTQELDPVNNSSLDLGDVDGDGDLDLFLNSSDGANNTQVTKLYLNNGLGHYTEDTVNNFLPGRDYCDSRLVDLDGDKDLDLVYVDIWYNFASYTNDGLGNFTANTWLDDITVSAGVRFDFDDVDVDDDLDMCVHQVYGSVRSTSIYLNNGGDMVLSQDLLPGKYLGNIEFGDVNGDSLPEILSYGDTATSDNRFHLYVNNGSGIYSEASSYPFSSLDYDFGSAHFGDIDGDSDLDILIQGYENGSWSIAHTHLYLNDGVGGFTESSNTIIADAGSSYAIFDDFDLDGDDDLLQMAKDPQDAPYGKSISKLYQNNGVGGISLVQGTDFKSYTNHRMVSGDINGDGYPDMIVSGQRYGELGALGRSTDVYINKTGCVTSYSSVDVLVCSEFTTPVGGVTYYSPGPYNDTLVTSLYCDSIVTYNVSFHSTDIDTTTMSACEMLVSPSGRYTWDSTGIYQDTLFGMSSHGCDSITIIDLTINQPIGLVQANRILESFENYTDVSEVSNFSLSTGVGELQLNGSTQLEGSQSLRIYFKESGQGADRLLYSFPDNIPLNTPVELFFKYAGGGITS